MNLLENYIQEINNDPQIKIKFLHKYDVMVTPGNDNEWKLKLKMIEKLYGAITSRVASVLYPIFKNQCLKVELDKSKCKISKTEFLKNIPVKYIRFFSDDTSSGVHIIFNVGQYFENPYARVNIDSKMNIKKADVSLEGA